MRSIVVFLALVAVASAQFVPVPGGEGTGCADGSDFTFFFRQGTSNKLAIYFEGGGACWDAFSCAAPIYSRNINPLETGFFLNNLAGGILDLSNEDNALTDYSIVYIPYCTGDVHAGANVAAYGVQHIGHLNFQNALAFAKSQMPAPETVATLGCSAGALGATVNAPYVIEAYPDARHAVWGDSFVGITSPIQWAGAWDNWKIQLNANVPGLEESTARQWTPDRIASIYTAQANFFPHTVFSIYTSRFDTVQSDFYAFGGGSNWGQAVLDLVEYVHANTDQKNWRTFISGGDEHCRSFDNSFYDVRVGDVFLARWVEKIIDGNGNGERRIKCEYTCLFATKFEGKKQHAKHYSPQTVHALNIHDVKASA